VLWTNGSNPKTANWERREELAAQFGQARADWMVAAFGASLPLPNVILMDQFSSQSAFGRSQSIRPK